MGRSWKIVAIGLAALLGIAAAAHAGSGLVVRGTVEDPCGDAAASLGRPGALAVSPDNAFVYVADAFYGVIDVFAIGAGGTLSYVETAPAVQLRGLAISPDGATLYATNALGRQLVVFARDEVTGSLTVVQALGIDTDGTPGLDGAAGVAVSADGAQVYTASSIDGAVDVFARDPVTGLLTFVELQQDGVGGVDGLGGAAALTVTADGAHVYATGESDAAVAVFSRDATTGKLTFVEAQRDGVGGVDGLGGALAVAASADGAAVLVVGGQDNALAVFARNPGTGALTFTQLLQDGAGGVDGLSGADALAVSANGRDVYVTGDFDFALARFRRDPSTGVLTPGSVLRDNDDGVDGLFRPTALALAPDGAHLFVTAFADQSIASFARDASTGALALADIRRFQSHATDVALSPDGASAYVACELASRLAVFTRDAVTGLLTRVETHLDGVGGVDGLRSVRASVVSPDGRHVYAASAIDAAVAVFARDPATGRLTFVTALRSSVALFGAVDLAISPDGAHLYVAASFQSRLTVLARDAATGLLTIAGLVSDNSGGVDGLASVNGVAVSPDGAHVYATSAVDQAVAVFARHATTGALTFVEAVHDAAGSLFGAGHLAISSAGGHVYVTAAGAGRLVIFARDPGLGQLTKVGEVGAIDGAGAVAVSPEGEYVYAGHSTGPFADRLSVFRRDAASGLLTLVEVQGGGSSPGAPDGLAVSADGSHVYGVGLLNDRLGVFGRDAQCTPAPQEGCRRPVTGRSASILVRATPARVTWRWRHGAATSAALLGDPTLATGYAFCVYDAGGGLGLGLSAPSGSGGWRARPTGFRYLSASGAPEGARRVDLIAGTSGHAQLRVRAAAPLVIPPLSLVPPVTAQLQAANGVCWEAEFASPSRDDAGIFRARAD